MTHPTTPNLPPASEDDSTAAKIRRAALEVLAREGVHGATTRAIAETAGVNEVTLFRRFGTKQNLLRVAISDRLQETMGASTDYTGDLEGDLVRLAGQYHGALKVFGPLARVLFTEIAHTSGLQSSIEVSTRSSIAISQLFEKYQRDGKLVEAPLHSVVAGFLGPIAMPFIIDHLTLFKGDDLFDAQSYVQRFLQGHGRTRATLEA